MRSVTIAARFYALLLAFAIFLAGCGDRPLTMGADAEVLATPSPFTENNAPAGTTAAQEDAPAEEAYRLASGDVLQIRSFYHEEINQQVTIRPDGRIALLLIPEMHVAGLTVDETQKRLVSEYAKVLRDPKIAVILQEAVGQRVYVGGEVKTPAVLPLRGRLTCIQALMQAGGLTRDAYVRNVVVLRNTGGAKPEFIKLNLKNDFDRPERGLNDIELKPYDIVLVPRTQISKFNQIVEQYIEKMIPIQQSFGLTYELSKVGAGL